MNEDTFCVYEENGGLVENIFGEKVGYNMA